MGIPLKTNRGVCLMLTLVFFTVSKTQTQAKNLSTGGWLRKVCTHTHGINL